MMHIAGEFVITEAMQVSPFCFIGVVISRGFISHTFTTLMVFECKFTPGAKWTQKPSGLTISAKTINKDCLKGKN